MKQWSSDAWSLKSLWPFTRTKHSFSALNTSSIYFTLRSPLYTFFLYLDFSFLYLDSPSTYLDLHTHRPELVRCATTFTSPLILVDSERLHITTTRYNPSLNKPPIEHHTISREQHPHNLLRLRPLSPYSDFRDAVASTRHPAQDPHCRCRYRRPGCGISIVRQRLHQYPHLRNSVDSDDDGCWYQRPTICGRHPAKPRSAESTREDRHQDTRSKHVQSPWRLRSANREACMPNTSYRNSRSTVENSRCCSSALSRNVSANPPYT